jgi:hypothetical protein
VKLFSTSLRGRSSPPDKSRTRQKGCLSRGNSRTRDHNLMGLGTGRFVMGPHSDHLDCPGPFQNLVDKAMLNRDSAGGSSGKIADKLLEKACHLRQKRTLKRTERQGLLLPLWQRYDEDETAEERLLTSSPPERVSQIAVHPSTSSGRTAISRLDTPFVVSLSNDERGCNTVSFARGLRTTAPLTNFLPHHTSFKTRRAFPPIAFSISVSE